MNAAFSKSLHRTSRLLRLAFCFSGIWLAGCGSSIKLYDGPQRPPSEVVMLISEKYTLNHNPGIRLHSIDGVPGPHPAAFGYSSPWDGTFRIELLPGSHTLTVGYNNVLGQYKIVSTINITLPFDGQAGHVYLLGARYSLNQWIPTLKDTATGEPIHPASDNENWKILKAIGVFFIKDEACYRGADGKSQIIPRSDGVPMMGLNEGGAYVIRGVIREDTLSKIIGRNLDIVQTKAMASFCNAHRIALVGSDGHFTPGQRFYLVDKANIGGAVLEDRTVMDDDLHLVTLAGNHVIPLIDGKPIVGYCVAVQGGIFTVETQNRLHFASGPGMRVVDLTTAAADSLPEAAQTMQETMKKLGLAHVRQLDAVRSDDGSLQVAIKGVTADGKKVAATLRLPAGDK